MNKLMLSCKKATELIEKKAAKKLGLIEAIRLRMHTLMCSACAAYEKHSHTLDQVLSKWTKKEENNKNKTLSDDVKSKIINKIKNNK